MEKFNLDGPAAFVIPHWSQGSEMERKWLDEIVAGTKKVEYREIKPYWTKRLEGIECPFELRLINGMSKSAPEATVRIDKVTVGDKGTRFELHIGEIVSAK